MNDTRIVEIKHTAGDWHQYDVQLNFAYGWSYILNSAQNLITKDLLEVDELITADNKGSVKNHIESLRAVNNVIRECPEFITESAALSITGTSSEMKLPVKVMWFTQTQTLRVFAIMEVSDEDLRNFISKCVLVV